MLQELGAGLQRFGRRTLVDLPNLRAAEDHGQHGRIPAVNAGHGDPKGRPASLHRRNPHLIINTSIMIIMGEDRCRRRRHGSLTLFTEVSQRHGRDRSKSPSSLS